MKMSQGGGRGVRKVPKKCQAFFEWPLKGNVMSLLLFKQDNPLMTSLTYWGRVCCAKASASQEKNGGKKHVDQCDRPE